MAIETNDLPSPEEPESLKRDLKALYQGSVPLPQPLNAAMRAMIKEHFRGETRRILRASYLIPLAAAASILIVTLVSLHLHTRIDKPSVVHQALRKEDVDRNGVVDILDAFALAREIESLKGFDATRDMNGDGQVDEKDVEAVAYAAVSMEGGA